MKTVSYLSKEELLKKWEPVLDAGDGIANESVRLTTAQVLENTQSDSTPGSLVAEAQTTTNVAGFTQNSTAIGTSDVRWPGIVIPTVRRIFPELMAHELFGVQPMSSSLGYAYAIRAKYDTGSKFSAGASSDGTELGYNTMKSEFTGTSGSVIGTPLSANANMQAYAGVSVAISASNADFIDGLGALVQTGEGATVNGSMPMAKIDLVKGAVEAKSRKLAANWSPELAEDLANQHGVDVDAEMTNILTYEVQGAIDRQLVTTAVKNAINDGFTSTFTPASADGRNQVERIGALLTQVIIKSNEIATNTRRGAANFAIASPRVAGVIERLSTSPTVNGSDLPAVPQAGTGALTKVGLINGGKQLLLRDTFATESAGAGYILLGYKGNTSQDAGVIYCPYIPLQLMRAVKDSDFSPEIGVRTRYGIFEGYGTDTNWGAGRYYQFIKVDGLTSNMQVNGGRVFTF